MTAARGLHILMTADAVGGVWQYAVTLAGELAGAGHRVTLAVLGPPASEEQRAQVACQPRIELIDTNLPLDWLADGPDAVEATARGVARLAARRCADVVHCNSPALVGAARFSMPVVAVAHGCVASWWQAVRDEPLASHFAWHARMVRAGLGAADAVVAPSASFAAILGETYQLPRTPQVIHNGRAPLGTSGTIGRLDAGLAVGRLWDSAKNAAVLDRAAAQSHVPLLAVGAVEGPHGEAFQPRHMQVLGHRSEGELATLMRQRPVFVSAATFEPFGLAILEAASAGCALVLSNIPTFRELWDGAAVFVDQDDANGFAAALDALIRDQARRADLEAAAVERSARYRPPAMARAMLGIYEDVRVREEAAA